MPRSTPTTVRRCSVLAVVLLAAAVVFALAPLASTAQPTLPQLSSSLTREQARQQGLAQTIGNLNGSIASLSGQIAFVASREAAVRAQLSRDRMALDGTRHALDRERRLLQALRRRLARSRMLLARQLLSNYESNPPDLVTVVLNAGGFNDLLERLSYLSDAERQQQQIIRVTRAEKSLADAGVRRLGGLEAAQRLLADHATLQARALAGMNSLLQSRQQALAQAREAQQTALASSRARGSALQAQIATVQAQQAAARAAAAAAAAAPPAAPTASPSPSPSPSPSSPPPAAPALGPGGGWAIPYAVVMCESGGQNLPPNSAGASGYYQILASTWVGAGGTGPAAYLAPKSEQDAVAARLWAGGAGWANWVCAQMLGIH